MTSSTTRRTSARHLFVAVLALFALTAVLAPEVSAQEAEPSEDAIYIFGDSFASGEGVSFYVPSSDTPNNDCHKSLYSFGFRLFNSMNPSGPDSPNAEYPNRYFPACSGAKANDILFDDQEGDGPQILQVPPVADGAQGISVVAVGVNDLGFTPVLAECFFNTSCHTTSSLPQITDPEAQLATLAPKLYNVYQTLLNHVVGSGQMEVYVVGYPQLFNDSNDSFCDGILGFEPAERAWLNDRAIEMNNLIRLVTFLLPNVHFVEIDPYFEGHRHCDPEPWILPISIPIEHSFHPNGTGHFLTEQLVLQRLQADGF